MGDKTGISWTDATWNPIRGCSVVSAECTNCYAMGVAARFSGPGLPYEGLAKRSEKRGLPQWTGEVRLVPSMLDQPLRWKRPRRRIFVNSMSDLFHEKLSNEEIAAVFGVMAAAPQHTFQVLTKRPQRAIEWFEWAERMAQWGGVDRHRAVVGVHYAQRVSEHRGLRSIDWTRPWPLPNVHIGVSAGTQASADAFIPLLLRIPAAVRFVSAEPLLEQVNLLGHMMSSLAPGDCAACGKGHGFTRCPNTGGVAPTSDSGCSSFRRVVGRGIDWVIVGGESGSRARPYNINWGIQIIKQCRDAGVPVFHKQVGSNWTDGFGPGPRLKDRAGADPSEWPVDLRVQKFPEVRS